MKVGIIGSGGREHSICVALVKSKKIKEIYCFPGNAGTSQLAKNIDIDLNNFDKIKKFVSSKKILSKIEFEKKISEGFRYEVSKNKLKHDIEQISYLLKKKLISKKFKKALRSYKIVYNALPKNSNPTDIFTLTKDFTNKLGPTFNNLIYYQPPDILEKKLISDNKKVFVKNSKKKYK